MNHEARNIYTFNLNNHEKQTAQRTIRQHDP